jgi:hypothetical protein
MSKGKKKKAPYYGKGLPLKSEISSYRSKGEYLINMEYVEKDGLVKSFRLSMICDKPNKCINYISDYDNGRILGYDTAHRDKLGPCHRHCIGRKDSEKLDDNECGFLNILKMFLNEAQLVVKELGYKEICLTENN